MGQVQHACIWSGEEDEQANGRSLNPKKVKCSSKDDHVCNPITEDNNCNPAVCCEYPNSYLLRHFHSVCPWIQSNPSFPFLRTLHLMSSASDRYPCRNVRIRYPAAYAGNNFTVRIWCKDCSRRQNVLTSVTDAALSFLVTGDAFAVSLTRISTSQYKLAFSCLRPAPHPRSEKIRQEHLRDRLQNECESKSECAKGWKEDFLDTDFTGCISTNLSVISFESSECIRSSLTFSLLVARFQLFLTYSPCINIHADTFFFPLLVWLVSSSPWQTKTNQQCMPATKQAASQSLQSSSSSPGDAAASTVTTTETSRTAISCRTSSGFRVPFDQYLLETCAKCYFFMPDETFKTNSKLRWVDIHELLLQGRLVSLRAQKVFSHHEMEDSVGKLKKREWKSHTHTVAVMMTVTHTRIMCVEEHDSSLHNK